MRKGLIHPFRIEETWLQQRNALRPDLHGAARGENRVGCRDNL